jgi:hypothetical protein
MALCVGRCGSFSACVDCAPFHPLALVQARIHGARFAAKRRARHALEMPVQMLCESRARSSDIGRWVSHED